MENQKGLIASKNSPEARFGYMMGGVFSCLGLWQIIVHGRSVGGGIIALGALFLLLALIAPLCLKQVYVAWMRLAYALGWVNTRIILTLLYVFIFIPIGLILRIFGKDLLDQRISAGQPTYWVKEPVISDPLRYEKQY